MTKLSKSQLSERDTLTSELRDRRSDLDDAIESFNDKISALYADHVAPALEAYNEAVDAANQWRGDIACSIADYISDRSDKWQESDKGQAVESWRSEFDGELESAELVTPELLELDLEDAAELIEQLPEECEG